VILPPIDDRAAWLEWRRGGVGGSDVAALCGFSTFASPMTVYLDKTGQLPDDDGNEAMRWGQLLEPVIAREFEERTGLYVRCQQWCAQHDDLSWARATLDGLVIETRWPDDALGVYECKTTHDRTWAEKIPDHVAVQIQWQLGITGYTNAWLAVLHGGQRLDIHEIEANPAVFRALLDLAGRFWRDHVLAEMPPPADSNPATTRALKAAFTAVDEGQAVELDGDARDAALEWLHAKAFAAEAQRDVDRIENTLRTTLGEAEVATIDGEPVATWKQQQARRIDTTALRDAHPAIADEFTTTTTGRVLRSKAKALQALNEGSA
jgi:putative phage-type endonuclease